MQEYADLDKALRGTKDLSQNAMTAMELTTDTFSPCLYHSSATDMSVFRHGDVIKPHSLVWSMLQTSLKSLSMPPVDLGMDLNNKDMAFLAAAIGNSAQQEIVMDSTPVSVTTGQVNGQRNPGT